MFKSAAKAEDTRTHILNAALQLIRERGFDATTMRDIANASSLSLGAAYYYFPSKEAIVLAYYEQVQRQHRERVRAALPEATGLRARLGVLMHSKQEIIAEDRKILGALLRYIGEPGSPVSVLARPTENIREDVRRLTVEAIGDYPMAGELRDLVVNALWGMQMALILYSLYDYSPGQARTHRLIDDCLDLFVELLELASNPALEPMAGPLRDRLARLLGDAGLLAAAPPLADAVAKDGVAAVQ